jgi:hypothetical protein
MAMAMAMAYFKSPLSRSTPSLFQNVALHFHARQLGPESADFHLLGAHRRFAVSLLWRWALTQLNSICSTTPSAVAAATMLFFHQAHRLLFKFEHVARP